MRKETYGGIENPIDAFEQQKRETPLSGQVTMAAKEKMGLNTCPNIRPSVCLHIPHSSGIIPVDSMLPLDIFHERLRLTDWHTEKLFELSEATRIIAPVSRLVVDVERFLDDANEPMAAVGMGATYTKRIDGTLLRSLAPDDRNRLIEKYYVPHHAALNAWANASIGTTGRGLIIDCHSFPKTPLACDRNQNQLRPAFCVGTSITHTPRWMVNKCIESLTRLKLGNVLVDEPYSGTIVPSMYLNDGRIMSIMIEVNRSLYMDELTGEMLPSFSKLVRELSAVMGDLVSDIVG